MSAVVRLVSAGLKLYACEILKLLIRATVSHMWSRLV